MKNRKFNGTVKLSAFAEYMEWYRALTYETAKAVHDAFKEWAKDLMPASHIQGHNLTAEQRTMRHLDTAVRDFFCVHCYCSYDNMDEKFQPIKEKSLRLMSSLQTFATDFEQPVHVAFWSEEYALIYIGNPEKGIPVVNPTQYLEYVPANDYSDITPAQMQNALCAHMDLTVDRLVPKGSEYTMTVKSAQNELNEFEESLAQHIERMKQTERCESPELIELKNQIEALQQEMWQKKAELMAELQEKLYQLEETKFRLEGQIYLLDSQIYSMLCYAGETIKFAKIRSGKNAPDTEPIVIHQKLRYLDEDLGRLASLYSIHWEEVDQFETFLAHHPLAFDTFAPNDRCVTLVRLSRTNRRMGMKADQFGAYNNIMEHYEYFHGSTVGIIIRNGENLYFGWTEQDRVDIADDLIIDRTVTDVQPAETPKFTFESDRRKYIEKQREEQKKVIDGVVSRSFVYSILQGVVDHTSMLPLPDNVKLDKQSQYVIYALADKWLVDNRFGTLEDIVTKANETIHAGDMILTTQLLVPEREYGWSRQNYDPRWKNVRGRGDKNRTHDCSVDDCELYPVNLVEFDPNYFEAYYTKDGTNYVAGGWDRFRTKDVLDEYMKRHFPEVKEYRTEEIAGDRHVFVSVRKEGFNYNTWEQTNARANFELHDGEYINLNNLSSMHLEYAITNRNVVEGYRVGGKEADYAFLIRYLKTAMEHVTEREQAEKQLIDAVDPAICQNPEWVMDILSFKREKNVRNFNETWAKRFVNWLAQKKEEQK